MRSPILRLAMPALAATAIALLAGCSHGRLVRRSEPRIEHPSSNAPAAIVFSDPALALPPELDPNFARRDPSLSPLYVAALQARDQWPEPERPSLRDTRRLQLNARPDTYLYFDGGDSGWGGGRESWRREVEHEHRGRWRPEREGRDNRPGW